MQLYKELVGIITRHKRNQLHVIGYDKGDDATQYDKLYDYLEKEEEPSFENSQALFFPPEKKKQFNNLLGGFKRRLINALFLIDAKKSPFGTVKDAHFNTWKNLAAAKIMMRFSAYGSAEDLIKQTLPHSISTENFLVTSEFYRMLGRFAGRRIDMKLAEKYFLLYQKEMNKHIDYTNVCQLHLELNTLISNVKSTPKKFGLLANAYLNDVKNLIAKTDADRIWVYYYSIAYFSLAFEKRHEEITSLLDEAISRLTNSKAVDREIVGGFHHLLVISQAAMGDLEACIETSKDQEKFIEPGKLNWFISRESMCLIFLYYGRYSDALKLYLSTTAHRKFKLLSIARRENWILIEAFLHLLIQTNNFQPEGDSKLKKFSLARFTNQVIVNNKDKQGFNITFQILQILFLLHEQQWNDAEDKIMAIYKYTQRHFELEETDRTVCFVMALTQLPRGGFSQLEVKERSAEWLEKMQAIPPMQTTDPFEVEVIPYQKLWEIAIQLLPAVH